MQLFRSLVLFLCMFPLDDAFSAMQIIAILILSIAMVVLMGALFCPEEKVRRLGCVGGGLLIAYSVFQLIAVAIFGSLFSGECLTALCSRKPGGADAATTKCDARMEQA